MTDQVLQLRKRSVSISSRVYLGLSYALLGLLSAVWILPAFYSFTTSMKSPTEIANAGFKLMPANWVVENYASLISDSAQYPVIRWFGNSLVMSLGHGLLTIIVISIAAFGYTRIKFPGRDILFLTVLGVTLFPSVVNLIPSYKITQALGWINTPWAVIVPGVAGAANIFLVRSFMAGIPKEMDEAARIDGAGDWKIFGRIILPNIKPVLIVIFLFSFTGAWNDFLWPTIVFNDVENMPITAGLLLLQNRLGGYSNLGQLMASAVLAMIPTTALFLVAQKYFIGSLNLTAGLKG